MMSYKKRPVLLCFVWVLVAGFNSNRLHATVAMKFPFSNHMVLQRNAKVNLWGTGARGEIVTVKFNGQTKTTTTGTEGIGNSHLILCLLQAL